MHCRLERSSPWPKESSWNARAWARTRRSPPSYAWHSTPVPHCVAGPRRWSCRPNDQSSDRNGGSMTEDGYDALDVLDAYRQEAGLSHGELWLRYFELGGMSTGLELEAFLYGVLLPSAHDHDVIAHAINTRFVALGGNHPVAYSKDHKSDS